MLVEGQMRSVLATLAPIAALALVGVAAAACTRSSPITRTAPADAPRIVFTQERARRANAPSHEEDVDVPTGHARWVLELRCRDHGRPCPRASVEVHLRFAMAEPPANVRASLRKPWQSDVVLDSFDHCWETMFAERPPNQCTHKLASGWEADALARRWGEPNPDEGPSEDRARELVLDTENGGPPLRARLIVYVIDPLE